MKIIREFELKEMIERASDNLVVEKDIGDEKLKRFLCYYALFTNNRIALVGKEDKNTLLYSKYYWYTKYKNRHFEVYGYDAGVEQEGIKLLEELENELDGGIDWVLIQDIDEENVMR